MEIITNPLFMRRNFCRQFRENSLNFLLFLQFQFPQCIVCIDSGHRLYKIGRTGSRHIMHKARNIILTFTLNRNNITALANRNDRFPQKLGIGRRRNYLLQTVLDFCALYTHVSADIRKRRARRIRNLFLRKNRTKNAVFKILVWGKHAEQRVKNCGFLVLGNICLHSSGIAQKTCDR